jgi:cytochrome c biogenesis protein CcdA
MMTRLELLVAAGVLIAVCALSCAQPGFGDLAAADSAGPSPLASLIPLQRYSFHIAAIAVTFLGLLLEDGRRRAVAERDSSRPLAPPRIH